MQTMWMLQPAVEPIQVTISLPQTLVDSLGIGAEVLAKYLTGLTESGAHDPESHPPPMPILCRVCERNIVPWWFEKHSDLCVQEHKAEMDVQMVQENLAEHRNTIVKVIDGLEARQGRPTSTDVSPALQALPEYKGVQIGVSSNPPSSSTSRPGSHVPSPARSSSPSAGGLGHSRGRSFAVRRPLARYLEVVLDLCDTASDINTPSIKETKSEEDDEFRTQSPQSESRINQVLQFTQPSNFENEPGLALLYKDTESLARAKVEAVHRHQFIIEYGERIRQEYMAEVDACISEALEKAERVAAGEPLSSSESDAETQSAEEERSTSDEPTPMPLEPDPARAQSYVGLKSLASALRNPLELAAAGVFDGQRRSSSQAVSSRSSSPAECPTPKSHRGTILAQPVPVPNRRSLYLESDANDSDASLTSSVLSGGNWRSDSPASETALSRTTSSRDRKRRSMHLHGLGSGSPRRQSPGRYPPPPASPLRISKPRLPSGESSFHSPIVSPLLTAGEFMPPGVSSHHHRRQSSVHVSEMRAPPSPRVSGLAQPPQRAQPPSIKDFEIIKPISKGAFGSVYLSKKKLTGEYFAIKVLRKSDMVAKNQVTNVKAERAIMMWQGESDFVAKLYWTFSSKEYLYLVMEYLNGGDCASLVKILGGLTEDWAKKYIAEVVLGVEHLHSRGIVHRDLKPDNLLIDSKGHLKLTDFGLSRMGLVGRQKRALKSPDDFTPDLLHQGPFARSTSATTSRSASFDYHGTNSPSQTPLMTPALGGALEQPSYFSLNRESSLSRDPSRRTSGHRSESGSLSSHDLHHAFKSFSLHDSPEASVSHLPSRSNLIEEESQSQGSASPDLYPLSQSVSNISQATTHPQTQTQMLPPAMALFDPEDSKRRFVGTPDYLAPEIIAGSGQDETSDWWSMGCILFEFLFGVPPFNAETPDQVFDNIVHRRICWPDESEYPITDEAKDLINKLIQLDPRQRLGSNTEEKFSGGGAEIKAHLWFSPDINWETLLEDEAQFIPNPENPEDTEYFDPRGATLQAFPEENEDSASPSGITPGSHEAGERPHDALFRARTQANMNKRGLMPLSIPPHVARDTRSRRLSEPVIVDDFGNFTYKNLPVLEKANKDIVEKMRQEAMTAQSRGWSGASHTASNSTTSATSSPAPSLEGSPMLPMPVKRALSINKGHHRPASPSGLGSNSSPSRPSQPSSPLLVQFSTAQNIERRKTSGSSQSSGSLQPGSFFDLPRDKSNSISSTSSPIKNLRMPPASPAKQNALPSRSGSLHGRARSQTVGSQEGDAPRESYLPAHHKRRSQIFAHEVSPSSSDTENNPQAKAFLKVQRRRQSSRRLSQFNLMDGPHYRPLDVLICEDNPVSKMTLERLLERLKCRTIVVSNGSEALRVAISQIPFDIIFTEYKLPLYSGQDVARMIRDTQSTNTHTPIVCVTGYLKELPEVHKFDSLVQKPATQTKLTEVLAQFCQWKPPPKDFKLTAPLTIPQSLARADFQSSQESPSSAASSIPLTMPDSSYKGSSRGDSISSGGFFSDLDSLKSDEVPVIISRAATSDWSEDSGGLGIIGSKQYSTASNSQLLHTESAPGSALPDESKHVGWRTPRRQRSSDAVKQKRELLESTQGSGGGAEEGDDEDEVLGDIQVRARSPLKQVRTSSKLGQEMMRTNSRGSVISTNEEARTAEPDALRKSLEILEGRMEALKIPEEVELPNLIFVQPRKLERTSSHHSHPDPEVEASDPQRPPSRGHITPPVIFPQKPGDTVADFQITTTTESTEVTPVPTRTINFEEEPTPRPQGSPSPGVLRSS